MKFFYSAVLIISFLSLQILVQSCAPAIKRPELPKLPPSIADTVGPLLIGSFSSAEQAKNDTNYFDIRLNAVRIWEDTPGYWIYVEQAMASNLDKPYRQRVYHVFPNLPRCISQVYTIKGDSDFVGLWKDKSKMKNLTIDKIELKNGCEVVLERKGDKFVGGTQAKDCKSELNGAKYVTSEVILDENGLISWDRGYSAEGTQVWGAKKGGYIFKRVK